MDRFPQPAGQTGHTFLRLMAPEWLASAESALTTAGRLNPSMISGGALIRVIWVESGRGRKTWLNFQRLFLAGSAINSIKNKQGHPTRIAGSMMQALKSSLAELTMLDRGTSSRARCVGGRRRLRALSEACARYRIRRPPFERPRIRRRRSRLRTVSLLRGRLGFITKRTKVE